MEETQIKYDEDQLEKIRVWLKEGKHPDGTVPDCWVDKSLNYCLSLIEQLRDENESLWFMLEENKESQWGKEHSAELEKSIEQHLTLLKLMQMKKGEA